VIPTFLPNVGSLLKRLDERLGAYERLQFAMRAVGQKEGIHLK
jgi:hypothetical protein